MVKIAVAGGSGGMPASYYEYTVVNCADYGSRGPGSHRSAGCDQETRYPDPITTSNYSSSNLLFSSLN